MHKAKDITLDLSIARRREEWKEGALDTLFIERARKGHRQSDEHRNCFKATDRETFNRQGRAHMGFSERVDTVLN